MKLPAKTHEHSQLLTTLASFAQAVARQKGAADKCFSYWRTCVWQPPLETCCVDCSPVVTLHAAPGKTDHQHYARYLDE